MWCIAQREDCWRGYISNKERGDQFCGRVGEYLALPGLLVEPEYAVDVGLNSRRKAPHKFDYGNRSLLVECKYYKWTAGGNNPSAKISTLNEAMAYFHTAPKHYRKMVFIASTEKKGVRKPGTFAEYYQRLHGHMIPDDVEVCELNGDSLSVRRIEP